MLTPGTRSSSSATMLPAMTTPKNFIDRMAGPNAASRGRAGRWDSRFSTSSATSSRNSPATTAVTGAISSARPSASPMPATTAATNASQPAQAGSPGRASRSTAAPPVEQLVQSEPQRHQGQQGQAERLQEDAAKFGREEAACGGAGGSLEDHCVSNLMSAEPERAICRTLRDRRAARKCNVATARASYGGRGWSSPPRRQQQGPFPTIPSDRGFRRGRRRRCRRQSARAGRPATSCRQNPACG